MGRISRISAVWLGVMGSSSGCVERLVPLGTGEQATESGPASSEGGTPGSGRCSASAAGIADCIESEGYTSDLRFIAQIRVPGDTHWRAVQELCFDRFSALGYEVELQEYGTGTNVIGRKAGAVESDESVVLGAHYDHIPGCNGADDNATGVAGVLELARVLASHRFERSLTVACWDQEEIGLIGSRAFVGDARDRGEEPVVNFNLEMIGYASDAPGSQEVPTGFDALFPEAYAEVEANDFRGDFVAFVGDEYASGTGRALTRFADRYSLPNVWLEVPAQLKSSSLVGDLRRSDHAPFWDADIPAIMITDTSNFRYAYYHCGAGEDSVDRLDMGFSTAILRATAGAMVEALGLTESRR